MPVPARARPKSFVTRPFVTRRARAGKGPPGNPARAVLCDARRDLLQTLSNQTS